MLAVVKANAYGHGIMRVARALADADAGVEGFALLELDAAIALRQAGFKQRIVLLEGFFETKELAVLAEHHIDTVVHCTEQVAMLRETSCGPAGAKLNVLLKLNTGMNRLGFGAAEFPSALAALSKDQSIAANGGIWNQRRRSRNTGPVHRAATQQSTALTT